MYQNMPDIRHRIAAQFTTNSIELSKLKQLGLPSITACSSFAQTDTLHHKVVVNESQVISHHYRQLLIVYSTPAPTAPSQNLVPIHMVLSRIPFLRISEKQGTQNTSVHPNLHMSNCNN